MRHKKYIFPSIIKYQTSAGYKEFFKRSLKFMLLFVQLKTYNLAIFFSLYSNYVKHQWSLSKTDHRVDYFKFYEFNFCTPQKKFVWKVSIMSGMYISRSECETAPCSYSQ